jgi:hypothetical protein
MLWKIIFIILITVFSTMVSFGNGIANDLKDGKNMCGDNCIKISMSLDRIENLKCSDFVRFPAKKIKHKLKDNRLRLYYKFKPLMSVAMREIDINSYFELIFENEKLLEINQYDLKGNFVKKYNKIYCWIE